MRSKHAGTDDGGVCRGNAVIDSPLLVRGDWAARSSWRASAAPATSAVDGKAMGKAGGKKAGKLLLVDLAGSERAGDCKDNEKDRQMEGTEINKSLLALKECVRAIDS